MSQEVYVLFNPLSGNGSDRIGNEVLERSFPGAKVHFQDITTVTDYHSILGKLSAEDAIVICGGDGTLNRFVNATYEMEVNNSVYYYPTGSGNDFLRDLGKTAQDGPVRINDYIHNLPSVSINGTTSRFLNGVGYGLDGYCCEVGEQMRKEGKKPDYTAIAIKGLLVSYKPTNATVIVDGVEHSFRRVWIAPTMHGRYYGGGMMAAPAQQRNNEDGKISLMLIHKSGKIGTLCVFPSIFKGKHINHTKCVTVLEGYDITVRFDRPATVQIDGEVVYNVSEYRAFGKSIDDK